MGTYTIAGIIPDYWYVCLATCGALLVYHVDRAFSFTDEDEANSPTRLEWLRTHRFFLWISSIVCAGLSLISIFLISSDIVGACLILAGIGLFYNVRLPFLDRRLKDLQGFRIGLIVMCWVAGGVYLPLHDRIPPIDLVYIILWKSFIVIPNVLMAEWVDRKGDLANRIPGVGSRLSKTTINSLSSLCLVAALICVWQFQSGSEQVVVGPIIVELVAMFGLVGTVVLRTNWKSENIVGIDMWIGLPLISWIAWSVLSAW